MRWSRSVMRQSQGQYALEPVPRSAFGTEPCPRFLPDCMPHSRHFRLFPAFQRGRRADSSKACCTCLGTRLVFSQSQIADSLPSEGKTPSSELALLACLFIFRPLRGSNMFFRNVGRLLTNHVALQNTRSQSSLSVL
jgi:hypothetical protein